MSRSVWIGGFGIMVAGGLLAVAFAQETAITQAFSVYQGRPSQLPVRFEYPSGWQAEESSGTAEVYSQVQLYAPASFEHRLRAYMVVRVLPSASQGGQYSELDELVEAYVKTLLPTMRVEEERHATVLGLPARQLTVTGTMQLPWRSLQSQPVPVQGQRVFFEHQGRLYELGWLTAPDTASDVERWFTHLLDTLAFHG